MATGWQKLGSTWYYLNGSGAMQTGWQTIGKYKYYFYDSGAMASGCWVDDCYLTSSGAMAVKQWIGDKYVGADGHYVSAVMKWPCPAYTRVSSDFGYRDKPSSGASSYHQGVDLAAPEGSSILAASSGTIVRVSANGTMGNYIEIDHGDGLHTIYMHMLKFASSSKKGAKVSAGDVIGYVGHTGEATGNHLHFGVSVNGTYVSPWNYIPDPR